MNCNYVMQFNYSNDYINDCLLPWNKSLKLEKINDKHLNSKIKKTNIDNFTDNFIDNLTCSISDNDSNTKISNSNIYDTGWINNRTNIDQSEIILPDEEYQSCIVVKCPINIMQFITPFFIHVPYSSCRIFNNGKSFILKLNSFCYFTRLASYILLEEDNKSHTKKEWNHEFNQFYINAISIDQNYDLNKINNIEDKPFFFAKTVDEDIVHLPNIEINFKNILNQNIYPFIWIEANLNNELSDNNSFIDERLVPGTAIFQNQINSVTSYNEFIGIIYNCTDGKINIIPNISIFNIMSGYQYTNVFFEYDVNPYYNKIFYDDLNINELGNKLNSLSELNRTKKNQVKKNQFNKAPIIVKQIFKNEININIDKNDSLKVGDYIMSINDNDIKQNCYIYLECINIDVPINTYLYYTQISKHKFKIIRNNKLMEIFINTKYLFNQINFKISITTIFSIKDNIIFAKPNLLMIEWLTYNNIIVKNNLYLQYMINPFYKTKQNNLMIGLINIDQHPETVRDMLKPYINDIYNIDKYIEFFTVLVVNMANSAKIDNHKTINKITICDSNENEINLNWIAS